MREYRENPNSDPASATEDTEEEEEVTEVMEADDICEWRGSML